MRDEAETYHRDPHFILKCPQRIPIRICQVGRKKSMSGREYNSLALLCTSCLGRSGQDLRSVIEVNKEDLFVSVCRHLPGSPKTAFVATTSCTSALRSHPFGYQVIKSTRIILSGRNDALKNLPSS